MVVDSIFQTQQVLTPFVSDQMKHLLTIDDSV